MNRLQSTPPALKLGERILWQFDQSVATGLGLDSESCSTHFGVEALLWEELVMPLERLLLENGQQSLVKADATTKTATIRVERGLVIRRILKTLRFYIGR